MGVEVWPGAACGCGARPISTIRHMLVHLGHDWYIPVHRVVAIIPYGTEQTQKIAAQLREQGRLLRIVSRRRDVMGGSPIRALVLVDAGGGVVMGIQTTTNAETLARRLAAPAAHEHPGGA